MIFDKIKNAFFKIAGIYPAGRTCPVRRDDVFIVSYPKSGNTWVRFLVANLLHPEIVNFENIEKFIPDIHQHTLLNLMGMKSPRILKSHQSFDRRYKKIIYIVRDPRDVVVSYWHHKIKFRTLKEDFLLEKFAEKFLSGSGLPFGTWVDHVTNWVHVGELSPNVLILRYEDLVLSTENEIEKIICHLGLKNITNEIVGKAIKNASFENMRKMEIKQQGAWDLTKNTKHDMLFVRKGHVGGWKAELPFESAKRIETAWRPWMTKLGYDNFIG